jgi:hypothetical protein
MMRIFGPLTDEHFEMFSTNPLYVGVALPPVSLVEPLVQRFPTLPVDALDVLEACLIYVSYA